MKHLTSGLSNAQADALAVSDFDIVDVAEQMVGGVKPPDELLIGLSLMKSNRLKEAAIDLHDFRIGDTLARRTTILANHGFKKLEPLVLGPDDVKDGREDLLGAVTEATLHVWVHSPLGLVYVLDSQTRDRNGEVHQYIGHGRLHYCSELNEGPVPCGGYVDYLKLGHTWTREQRDVIKQNPEQCYWRGNMSGDSMLMARITSVVSQVRVYKKWPVTQIRYLHVGSMFKHAVEYGNERFSEEFMAAEDQIGLKRVAFFGDELASILNIDPAWDCGEQNGEFADFIPA